MSELANERYTMYVSPTGVIRIQEADYIEHGCYIEVFNNEITVFEIPYGGGQPIMISRESTIIEAINKTKSIT